MESVCTVVIIEPTKSSVNLSMTGVGSIVVPISARNACSLSLGNKVLHKIVQNKYSKYTEQNKKTNKLKNIKKFTRNFNW